MRTFLLCAVLVLPACVSTTQVSEEPPPITADAEAPSETGLSLPPLHQAALDGDTTEVARLLSAGTDRDALAQIAPPPEAVASPLHLAAASNHTRVVELLLAAGADVEAASPLYGTPLTLAAGESGGGSVLALLLRAGANADAPNGEGDRPLHRALANRNRPAATALAPSASPTLTDGQGRTPLVLASRAGYASAARALLKRGADPTRTDASGDSPLEAAADEDMTLLLLDWGADPGFAVAPPDRPARICVAVVDGNTFKLRSWAAQGVSMNVRCGGPFSPLSTAASQCLPTSIQTLLDLGADPNGCVPSSGRSTCGSGSVTHGSYPLAGAQQRLRTSRETGDAEEEARCDASIDILSPRTGTIPDDLVPLPEG